MIVALIVFEKMNFKMIINHLFFFSENSFLNHFK